ncbi:hypothetical protein B296_00052474 [Ensete ventricosum]|uniref:Uncharacterized protein n=1 Tax=Ensete ventricosum TaxID=4639 RepID=A0A426YCC3_ENSVE|nr:hypothetical protein B296_00052474 [Ensete ventricosum]
MGRRRVRREAAMTAPRRRGDNENSKGGRGCAPRVGGVAVYCRGIKECAHVILTRPHRGPVAQPEAGPGRTANGQKATGGDSDGVITGVCMTPSLRQSPPVTGVLHQAAVQYSGGKVGAASAAGERGHGVPWLTEPHVGSRGGGNRGGGNPCFGRPV